MTGLARRVTVVMTKEEHADLKRLAEERGLSVSHAVRRMLDKVLARPDFFLGPVLGRSRQTTQNGYDKDREPAEVR